MCTCSGRPEVFLCEMPFPHKCFRYYFEAHEKVMKQDTDIWVLFTSGSGFCCAAMVRNLYVLGLSTSL